MEFVCPVPSGGLVFRLKLYNYTSRVMGTGGSLYYWVMGSTGSRHGVRPLPEIRR